MKYSVYLKHTEGIFKVSELDCEPHEASRGLALYLARHYPVRFAFDKDGAGSILESVSENNPTGKLVWKEGGMFAQLDMGYFFVKPDLIKKEEHHWWKRALPASKQQAIEEEIKKAWKSGFSEGYSKGKKEEGVLISIEEIGKLYV